MIKIENVEVIGWEAAIRGMKFTGGYGSSACWYLFFTNERRNCSEWGCDKWAEELPEGIDDGSDTEEDISDCHHSAEYSGGYDVLLAEGY